jgi:hypothetical protein
MFCLLVTIVFFSVSIVQIIKVKKKFGKSSHALIYLIDLIRLDDELHNHIILSNLSPFIKKN